MDLFDKLCLNSTPIVKLEEFSIADKAIDVIMVFKSRFRPYYLLKDYVPEKNDRPKTIRAGVIYTRTADRNTPINQTVDPVVMEGLWKIRFGIDQSPLERGRIYILNPENWGKTHIDAEILLSDSTENANLRKESYTQYYYKDFPEFTIAIISDDAAGKYAEPNIISKFPDKNPGWWLNCYLKYHQTVLITESFIYVDGGRYLVALPEIDIDTEGGYFYNEKSDRYTLSRFVDYHENQGSYNMDTFMRATNTKIK